MLANSVNPTVPLEEEDCILSIISKATMLLYYTNGRNLSPEVIDTYVYTYILLTLNTQMG